MALSLSPRRQARVMMMMRVIISHSVMKISLRHLMQSTGVRKFTSTQGSMSPSTSWQNTCSHWKGPQPRMDSFRKLILMNRLESLMRSINILKLFITQINRHCLIPCTKQTCVEPQDTPAITQKGPNNQKICSVSKPFLSSSLQGCTEIMHKYHSFWLLITYKYTVPLSFFSLVTTCSPALSTIQSHLLLEK